MFKGIIIGIRAIIDITVYSNSDQVFYIKAQNLPSIYEGDPIACSGIYLTDVDNQ